MTNKKKIARIVVPLVIILTVGGLWIYKSISENSEVASNHDTPLEISSVDMNEVKSHNLPIMLDFGGEDCQPCQIMKPDLEKVHDELEGKALIYYIDVWAEPTSAEGFPIQVVPTQIFMNPDGTPYQPSDDVYNTVPGLKIYSSKETGEHLWTVHEGILTEIQMNEIFEDMGVKV